MPNSFYINLGTELVKPTLYLSFDDGPNKNTKQIIDFLEL